jgi:Kdo2-lipid IVA lauroyltransferase/acyltransferase
LPESENPAAAASPAAAAAAAAGRADGACYAAMRMWFLRLLSRLPLPLLYAGSTVSYWLLFRIGRLRVAVARGNIDRSFPERSAKERAEILDQYLRRITDMAFEAVKGLTLPIEELRERMPIEGLELIRARIAGGQPVMLLTAHHCNWEWLLLALSHDLGFPVEAMYKPLSNPLVQRFALALRTRFGTRLIPAKLMVPEMIKRKDVPRALAMMPDQVPQSSPTRFWVRFLSQDTAFYMGAEEISRAGGYPDYLILIERLARGRYRARVRLLAEPGDGSDAPREIMRRYIAALEQHLNAHPAEWLWSHKRWKLKKPLYAR